MTDPPATDVRVVLPALDYFGPTSSAFTAYGHRRSITPEEANVRLHPLKSECHIFQTCVHGTVAIHLVRRQETEGSKLRQLLALLLLPSFCVLAIRTRYWMATPTKPLLFVLMIGDKSCEPDPAPYPPPSVKN